MILLAGIPSEPPLQMVLNELRLAGVPHAVLHQRQFQSVHIELELAGRDVRGELRLPDQSLRWESITAVYSRLMDDRMLPELRDEPADSPLRRTCRRLHELLMVWCEVTPARVINRASAMSSNASKPYQLQLIRSCGFSVPETLITSDPEKVEEFRRLHDRVIYKSISGVRSIVRTLDDEAMQEIGRIRWCPVQFQAYVEGSDVRVHVVGEDVHATRIHSLATDYRYATRDRETRELEPVQLEDDVAEMCIHLSRQIGLAFSGIDLRITPDGRIYCFEVNPSPAFSFYESHTEQPIAASVVRYLTGS